LNYDVCFFNLNRRVFHLKNTPPTVDFSAANLSGAVPELSTGARKVVFPTGNLSCAQDKLGKRAAKRKNTACKFGVAIFKLTHAISNLYFPESKAGFSKAKLS